LASTHEAEAPGRPEGRPRHNPGSAAAISAAGDIESFFNKEEGKTLIEVRAQSVKRLFNALDPSPMEEKGLDDETAEYIAETVRELPRRTPAKLVLHLPPEEIWSADHPKLVAAVRNHFAYRARVVGKDLRSLLRQGWLSLLIGLAFLFGCITAREFAPLLLKGTPLDIVSEGLLIMGWVAMWRPLQVFLYDWWPLLRRRGLYQSLAGIEVEIKPTASGGTSAEAA